MVKDPEALIGQKFTVEEALIYYSEHLTSIHFIQWNGPVSWINKEQASQYRENEGKFVADKYTGELIFEIYQTELQYLRIENEKLNKAVQSVYRDRKQQTCNNVSMIVEMLVTKSPKKKILRRQRISIIWKIIELFKLTNKDLSSKSAQLFKDYIKACNEE